MKYSPETYAKAFGELLETIPASGHKKLVDNFIAAIRKNGDYGRMGKITEAVEKTVVKKNGGRWIRVEFARAVDGSLRSDVEKKFSAKDRIEEMINPEIIAGVRITIDGEKELDNSMRRKLNKLFNG